MAVSGAGSVVPTDQQQIRERTLDAIGDVLFAIDNTLEVVYADDAPTDVRMIECEMKELYVQAVAVMNRLILVDELEA